MNLLGIKPVLALAVAVGALLVALLGIFFNQQGTPRKEYFGDLPQEEFRLEPDSFDPFKER